jgi:hypothetical protein
MLGLLLSPSSPSSADPSYFFPAASPPSLSAHIHRWSEKIRVWDDNAISHDSTISRLVSREPLLQVRTDEIIMGKLARAYRDATHGGDKAGGRPLTSLLSTCPMSFPHSGTTDMNPFASLELLLIHMSGHLFAYRSPAICILLRSFFVV